MKPSLIVHGGAGNIPDEAVLECQAGCRRALQAGWEILSRGGPAADAVETAIALLEDDPVFDAGLGAHLNLDGQIELDAIMMDGRTLKAGAAAAIGRIRNPIRLARRILDSSPHMMLVAAGAERFATEQGMELCDPQELITDQARAALQRCREELSAAQVSQTQPGGTVGAVASDVGGNIVAGTSTGGTCGKHAGRVGDSPLIGCGCYADVEAGGVSCTGRGEAIMKIVMAKAAVDFLRNNRSDENGAPHERADSNLRTVTSMLAARHAIHLLATRVQGTGGIILIDSQGNPGFAFNTPHMAFGYVSDEGALVVGI